MCIFGSDCLCSFVMCSMEEGVLIDLKMVLCVIEKVQMMVEGRNFEICKNLFEYDDVMNKQCEVIYELCCDIFEGKEGCEYVCGLVDEFVFYFVDMYCFESVDLCDWNFIEIVIEMKGFFDIDVCVGCNFEDFGIDELCDYLQQCVCDKYDEQIVKNGDEEFQFIEKQVMFGFVDVYWKDYFLVFDYFKEGIYLCGYVQCDLKNEYKCESYDFFQVMKECIEDMILQCFYCIELIIWEEIEVLQQ